MKKLYILLIIPVLLSSCLKNDEDLLGIETSKVSPSENIESKKDTESAHTGVVNTSSEKAEDTAQTQKVKPQETQVHETKPVARNIKKEGYNIILEEDGKKIADLTTLGNINSHIECQDSSQRDVKYTIIPSDKNIGLVHKEYGCENGIEQSFFAIKLDEKQDKLINIENTLPKEAVKYIDEYTKKPHLYGIYSYKDGILTLQDIPSTDADKASLKKAGFQYLKDKKMSDPRIEGHYFLEVWTKKVPHTINIGSVKKTSKKTNKEYTIVTEKSQFFDADNAESEPRKAYVVRGDIVSGHDANEGFIYAEYTNSKGTVTKGYLEKNTTVKGNHKLTPSGPKNAKYTYSAKGMDYQMNAHIAISHLTENTFRYENGSFLSYERDKGSGRSRGWYGTGVKENGKWKLVTVNDMNESCTIDIDFFGEVALQVSIPSRSSFECGDILETTYIKE